MKSINNVKKLTLFLSLALIIFAIVPGRVFAVTGTFLLSDLERSSVNLNFSASNFNPMQQYSVSDLRADINGVQYSCSKSQEVGYIRFNCEYLQGVPSIITSIRIYSRDFPVDSDEWFYYVPTPSPTLIPTDTPIPTGTATPTEAPTPTDVPTPTPTMVPTAPGTFNLFDLERSSVNLNFSANNFDPTQHYETSDLRADVNGVQYTCSKTQDIGFIRFNCEYLPGVPATITSVRIYSRDFPVDSDEWFYYVPTPTTTQTPTETPTPTDTPIPTNTPTPTATPTDTPVPTATPFPTATPSPSPTQLTVVSPAKVWVGLSGVLSVGARFDLKAEVYKGALLITTGQINSVNLGLGLGGFNSARLQTIPFSAFVPVDFPQGSQLSIKVSERTSCTGSLNSLGTARLWYNDDQANSQVGVIIGDLLSSYYLTNNNGLSTSVGIGPKESIDVQGGPACSVFKPFGTWMITP